MMRTIIASLLLLSTAAAQERVVPKESKGGQKQGELWADVPETFRNTRIPQWSSPADVKQWESSEREKTKATLLKCLGDMPPRPDPARVKVTSREENDDYVTERFEFW